MWRKFVVILHPQSGNERLTALRGEGSHPVEEIEYNDMMPQDKQRRQRCRSSRDKGTRDIRGFRRKDSNLEKGGPDKQISKIYKNIYLTAESLILAQDER